MAPAPIDKPTCNRLTLVALLIGVTVSVLLLRTPDRQGPSLTTWLPGYISASAYSFTRPSSGTVVIKLVATNVPFFHKRVSHHQLSSYYNLMPRVTITCLRPRLFRPTGP